MAVPKMAAGGYTLCGHPAHSQAACGRCDACRDGRDQIGKILSAAQTAVAAYENDPRMLKDAMKKLQLVLDWKTR